ncbi:MAG TPA: hypothetical protein VF185_01935 [Patescibacteria group bacterium]
METKKAEQTQEETDRHKDRLAKFFNLLIEIDQKNKRKEVNKDV